MVNQVKILAVIPARGGSKGIPKKNIRLLSGMPLISYAIKTALKCKEITDVYVTTDSEEIAEVAENYGAQIVERSSELSGDQVTLDPVIYNAVLRAEREKDFKYDYVITMQPTSPLLKPESLSAALEMLEKEKSDCVISVINKPHLSWKRQDGNIVPNYVQRLNRQDLPPNYMETGAFVITKRCMMTEKTRMAGKISVFQVSEDEGIDIDDKNDWILSEALLNRKHIIFRVDGYALLGMGHIYNCITLAYSMIEHEVLLVIQKDSLEGIKKIQETNLPYRVIETEDEIEHIIKEFRPDIWVNDRLNTTEEYMRYIKTLVPRVVTIEDLGDGTRHADAVINALYTDEELSGQNIYSGWRYVCLRDEFQVERPKAFSNEVKNVMVMFGGTDPCNYNRMLYDIILHISDRYPNVRFNFVVGIGYDMEKNKLITVEEKRVYVFPNVQRVTRFMREADLAITSQGRAIFEFASMGVPAIVLSQNEREKKHSFANMRNGFINLGIREGIEPELIENTLDWLIKTQAVRRNMYDLMIKYPLREGLERVKNIIVGRDRGIF